MSEQINFKPLHDVILVKRDETVTTTSSGIVFTTTNKEKAHTGVVLAVGPGRFSEQTGVFVPTTLQAGDRIYFASTSGYPVKLDPNSETIVMREIEIIGIDTTPQE